MKRKVVNTEKQRVNLLRKRAVTKNRELTYSLAFFADVNSRQIIGRISYVFRDGSTSIMSQGDPSDVRKYWHVLCRMNRARTNGRSYRHIIEARKRPAPLATTLT